ncbi:hypothetical protein AB0E08_08710 [Streptomyces sp. NPDC048281]|uniref:hypothetical protein n=1 Tax=Streptomyces sp. NPDC048281 TaxID=3154715 RepID=UPI00341E7A3B
MDTAGQHVEATDKAGSLFAAQLAIVGLVLVTALYAPRENSDRAFRLLDWMKSS